MLRGVDVMEGMRTLLREALGKSLRSIPDEDRLSAAWLVACGATMAEHGTVAGFRDGVVYVTVSDVAWMRQMQSMSALLQLELARIAALPVTGIHFEVDGSSSGDFKTARPGRIGRMKS